MVSKGKPGKSSSSKAAESKQQSLLSRPEVGIAVIVIALAATTYYVHSKRTFNDADLGSEELPHVLVIEGRIGLNDDEMNGEYVLRAEKVHGRPSWIKNYSGPSHTVYILWDRCNSWIVSAFPDAKAPGCEGWAFADSCKGLPWQCHGRWRTWEKADGWRAAQRSMVITPLWDRPVMSQSCAPEEERMLEEQMGSLDVVLPWVNGSDPAWLERWESTCYEWQWADIWPDAVWKAADVHRCLIEKDSLEEARAFVANGSCAEGALGREGACRKAPASQRVVRGLTTRESRCFRRFAAQCAGDRRKTIKDHDELRYLVRSLERHLPWHRGRILLIAPRGQAPSWLQAKGRMQILAQEELLKAALNSSFFIPAEKRTLLWRSRGYAPDRIFNDYPVQAGLAFLTGGHRLLMQIQDDLLFARPVSICELFTASPSFGMRLFATPYEGDVLKNPYEKVYNNMDRWSAAVWEDMDSLGTTKHANPYYRDLHLPQLLDTHILKDLWRDFPNELSAVVDTAFRYPNLTNVISLHHSEVARRSRAARPDGKLLTEHAQRGLSIAELDLAASSRVLSMMFDTNTDALPFSKRPWTEVEFTSLDTWHKQMAAIPPDPATMPPFLSLQDNLVDEDESRIAELDCLKEEWLCKLLPGPSSFEDPANPPRMCERWRAMLAQLNASTNETCSGESANASCAKTSVRPEPSPERGTAAAGSVHHAVEQSSETKEL